MISRCVTILAAILLLAWAACPAGAQPRGDNGGRDDPRAGFNGDPHAGFNGAERRFPRGGGYGFGGGQGPGFPPARNEWNRGAQGYQGGYPGAYPRAYGPPAGYERPSAPNSLDQGWRNQQDEVRRAVREGRHVPLGAAIEAVRRRAPGRELDAGLEPGPGGRPVYRLRWAGQDGRRTDYMVDATTGRILGQMGGP